MRLMLPWLLPAAIEKAPSRQRYPLPSLQVYPYVRTDPFPRITLWKAPLHSGVPLLVDNSMVQVIRH